MKSTAIFEGIRDASFYVRDLYSSDFITLSIYFLDFGLINFYYEAEVLAQHHFFELIKGKVVFIFIFVVSAEVLQYRKSFFWDQIPIALFQCPLNLLKSNFVVVLRVIVLEHVPQILLRQDFVLSQNY